MSTVANHTGRTDTATNENSRAAQEYTNYVTPEVNIFETKDGYVLEAELPGVSKEGLDIGLEGTTLTIIGRREPQDVKAEPVYRESTSADYRRVFELDPAIDTAKIEAKIVQGVLRLTLPKSEAVKPRKVVVSD